MVKINWDDSSIGQSFGPHLVGSELDGVVSCLAFVSIADHSCRGC